MGFRVAAGPTVGVNYDRHKHQRQSQTGARVRTQTPTNLAALCGAVEGKCIQMFFV